MGSGARMDAYDIHPGTIHGFEIAEQNEIVIESIERRVEKLSEAFTGRGI